MFLYTNTNNCGGEKSFRKCPTILMVKYGKYQKNFKSILHRYLLPEKNIF